MKKFLIVDGSNLLFQMFYGMPARIVNQDGKPIQGTLGFVGALLKIIRLVDPSHIAVVFDGECSNPRADIDSTYKANRPDYSDIPEEETPFSQLPDIYAALDFLGIAHKETENCESDDWIAGYALSDGYQEMVICSFDSDFFQLITPQLTVLRYRGKESILCDMAYIREKLGIEPEQYAAFKSLTGDNADNIPGVHKIGPKTAAFLMQQFGDLETMLSHTDAIRKPSIRCAVEANAQRIRTNYQLIKLGNASDLPFSPKEMIYKPRDITTTAVLQGIGLK